YVLRNSPLAQRYDDRVVAMKRAGGKNAIAIGLPRVIGPPRLADEPVEVFAARLELPVPVDHCAFGPPMVALPEPPHGETDYGRVTEADRHEVARVIRLHRIVRGIDVEFRY